MRLRWACLWECKYLVHGVGVPRSDKLWGTKAKITHRATRSPRLVALDCDVVTVYLSAIHRVFCLARVVLTPKLDHCSFLCKGNTYSDGSQRTIWSEEVVELEIGIVSRKEFD